MQTGLNVVIILGLAALLVILAWGLVNMFRGGNPNLSQNLMRARVLVQFAVLILLMAALFFFAPKPM